MDPKESVVGDHSIPDSLVAPVRWGRVLHNPTAVCGSTPRPTVAKRYAVSVEAVRRPPIAVESVGFRCVYWLQQNTDLLLCKLLSVKHALQKMAWFSVLKLGHRYM